MRSLHCFCLLFHFFSPRASAASIVSFPPFFELLLHIKLLILQKMCQKQIKPLKILSSINAYVI